MYPVQFFNIRHFFSFPTFFRSDSKNKVIKAGNTESSKYCNTLLFLFKKQ